MTDGEVGGRTPVTVRASAKLTLSLRITGVRPDGYHLLDAEMVSLDLADSLVIGEGDRLTFTGAADGDRVVAAGAVPAGPDNLVARALAAVGRTAEVHVTKRIPPGAGLGGGSADAAAILRWAGCADRALAASLGADVPFCLTGGRARVRGIGEDIEPLPFEARSFTLLLLPFGVDTGAAFRAWDELRARGGLPPPEAAGGAPAPLGTNDLERPTTMVEPRMGAWRRLLEDATGRRASLAGSGSTWFVEGTPAALGLGDSRLLELDGETGALVPVRTVPAVGPHRR
ncbi:MAG: 4-(cytidine 5'-diphospho)-2-C-methyl-D-erythritol kinase [Acidimicrobiales bacterium]